MFQYEKREFLANSNIKSFHILVHNNEHIMTLKYNKFKCYWAAVAEKKIVYIERDRSFPLKF